MSRETKVLLFLALLGAMPKSVNSFDSAELRLWRRAHKTIAKLGRDGGIRIEERMKPLEIVAAAIAALGIPLEED